MFRTVDGTEKNSNHCEKEEIITQSPYINIHFKGCLLSFVMESLYCTTTKRQNIRQQPTVRLCCLFYGGLVLSILELFYDCGASLRWICLLEK